MKTTFLDCKDDMDVPIKYPALVLANPIRQDLGREEVDYNYKPGREWLQFLHSTAGHAVRYKAMACTLLTPKPELVEKIQLISDYWKGTDTGVYNVSLDDIVEYRKQLNKELAVDCNRSYKDFAEAIYPIDARPQWIRRLVQELIPEDLDDWIEWKDDLEKHSTSIGRWSFYILGKNSD
jgi:hypothetical protein